MKAFTGLESVRHGTLTSVPRSVYTLGIVPNCGCDGGEELVYKRDHLVPSVVRHGGESDVETGSGGA